MEITPYGERRDGINSIFDSILISNFEEVDNSIEDDINDVDDDLSDSSGDLLSSDPDKVSQIEDSFREILGEPSLDNLMVIFSAIGMEKISISLSEDNEKLSLSGVINLSVDNKIRKDK